MEPETAEKIDAFIQVLESYKSGSALPFKIVVDDIAGNSYIENPYVA
jgi:C4-type Zn-finger protein